MDSEAQERLKLADAKKRLLEVAERATLRNIVSSHPKEALAGAFLAGMSAGGSAEPAKNAKTAIEILFDLL